MSKTKDTEEEFINPIDEDKVAKNPSTLPYAHTVGGLEIRPEDTGKIKGRAMTAMYEQTQSQMEQIKEQMQLLAKQAIKLQKRVQFSEEIYNADAGFEPLIGHVYYLYKRPKGDQFLSMVEPDQWGKSSKLIYQASLKLLSDHTWDVLHSEEEE